MPRHRTASYFFMFIILIVNLIAFWPSLEHAFRADTVTLFRQFALKDGFINSVVKMYDISRDLSISGGDYTQFRPICYWLISLERWIFGHNFMLWQATGIVLHCTLLILLYKLMGKIGGRENNLIALCLTFFFSTILISSDLVIWQGCHSWLLLVIFTIQSFKSCLLYTEQQNKNELIKAFIWMMLACFTSEAGMFLVAPIVLYTFFVRGGQFKKASLLLLTPIILYVVISLTDSSKAAAQAGSEFSDIVVNIFSIATIKNFTLALAWWLYAAFFPNNLTLELNGRLFEVNPITQILFQAPQVTSISYILGISSIGVITLAVLTNILNKDRRFRLFSRMILLSISLYIFVITTVRLNLRGIEGLNSGLYYSYLFWALFVVWLYTIISSSKLMLNKLYVSLFFAIIISMSCWNAAFIFRLNASTANSFTENKRLVLMVRDLVEQHKHEKDFSFYLSPYFPGNYPMPYVKTGNPWPCSFIEALFPKYFNGITPKYIL